ncbi:hypothetical protein N8T08_000505 [Aspergillus melleus]|uniref:Uncharacterized protein n=1 Tax=Aspergillus melleus TaxID=138277 RepID=A0ACC3AR73_9EURO|nr:hypothetical protein N8T08_000505 [Aspergillus melleus]
MSVWHGPPKAVVHGVNVKAMDLDIIKTISRENAHHWPKGQSKLTHLIWLKDHVRKTSSVVIEFSSPEVINAAIY